MELTKEFSEVLGMFAADGCMQKNYICMWGNISEDKDYYDNIVCPLFSIISNKKIIAHEKKSNSVYGFYLCNKEIIKIFKELGFNKNKTYDVEVPKPILENKDPEIQAAFIRGYADCDGNINFLKRKEKYCEFKRTFNCYPRIEISSVSKEVIIGISYMLKKLGIKHTLCAKRSYKYNEKDQLRISVRGKERVENWMTKIGLNNPAQYTKYLVWKKFGYCPPRITIEKRKEILAGNIDPKRFYQI